MRCSQPEVGLLYWRCAEDEKFLEALGSVDVKCASSSSTKPVPNGAEPRSNETGGCKDVNGAVLNSPNSNGISSMNYSSFHCFSTATVFLPTLVPSNAKLIGSLGAYYFSVLLDLGLLESGGGGLNRGWELNRRNTVLTGIIHKYVLKYLFICLFIRPCIHSYLLNYS